MIPYCRDVVYNISMRDFSVLRSIEWPASKSEVDECLMKGKPKVGWLIVTAVNMFVSPYR